MVMKTKGTARRDLFVYHAQQANFQWAPNFSSLWSFSVNACRIWRVPAKLLSTLVKSRCRYDCQGGFISETPSRCSYYSSERSFALSSKGGCRGERLHDGSFQQRGNYFVGGPASLIE